MRCLIARDLLDVVVKGRVVPSVGKVLLAEHGKAFTVKGILKMLECEGIVEDDSVVDLGSTLLNRRGSRGKASGREGNGSSGEEHLDKIDTWVRVLSNYGGNRDEGLGMSELVWYE